MLGLQKADPCSYRPLWPWHGCGEGEHRFLTGKGSDTTFGRCIFAGIYIHTVTPKYWYWIYYHILPIFTKLYSYYIEVILKNMFSWISNWQRTIALTTSVPRQTYCILCCQQIAEISPGLGRWLSLIAECSCGFSTNSFIRFSCGEVSVRKQLSPHPELGVMDRICCDTLLDVHQQSSFVADRSAQVINYDMPEDFWSSDS